MKGQGNWINGAEWKLTEAEFFLLKMKENSERFTDFLFYTSAFLSALQSSTEHNRLFSKDKRFPEWYRKLKLLHESNLTDVLKLRNLEVHTKDAATWEMVGIDIPKAYR